MKKLLLIAAVAAFSSSAMAADLHATCQEYFKQIESLQNLPEPVKAQLEASKQQIATLPATAQEQACKQGLESLKMMVPAK
ncbi:hypothetical protein BMT54_03620 [Pasteurellaceae bacterium 15-036681]|nr:hypothetical protein BMT54_03620 [Pasteurellaceae bacterium 15-036681]